MMEKRLLLPLLFLSMLLPAIFSASSSLAFSPPEFLGSSFFIITSIAILISILIIAIGKMLAGMMESEELKAWTREELFETGVSVLIIVFLVPAFAFLGEITHALVGSYDGFVGGGMFLDIMRSVLVTDYLKLMAAEVPLGILSTMGVHFLLPEWVLFGVNIGAMPLGGLGMVSNMNILLADALGTAIAAVQAQIVLLEFVRDNILAFFFPLGVLFRVFPVSRRVGSTLIAISLVLYFAYPLTLILNYYMYANMGPTITLKDFESIRELCSATNASEAATEQGTLQTDTTGAISNLDNTVTGTSWSWQTAQHKETVAQAMKNAWDIADKTRGWWLPLIVVDPRFVVLSSFDTVMGFVQPIMQLLVIAFVFPLIDFIICVTLFRSLSLTIGGEADLMGLARIV